MMAWHGAGPLLPPRAVSGGENCGEIHFGIGGERERAGERGRERVGRRDVTLMDEPFSVFSPIRKGGKSEGGREGAGGIHFHFHARSAPFLSQDIKTDFLGGDAALLLPRPRPAVVRWSGPSGGPRKGRGSQKS